MLCMLSTARVPAMSFTLVNGHHDIRMNVFLRLCFRAAFDRNLVNRNMANAALFMIGEYAICDLFVRPLMNVYVVHVV